MKTIDEVRQGFASAPANQRFGLRLITATDEVARVAMVADEHLRQEAGVIHGGAISALADTAAAYALIPTVQAGERMIGVEFKINFLQPAMPGGEELIAEARVRKRGRTLSVCEVDVLQGGNPVATGVFTYATGLKS